MTVYPLPEAIDGCRWKVAEGPGSIDTKARVLHVPLTDDVHARFIRNHELGHAAITPKQSSGKQCVKHAVSMRALQVCEDLRVHLYLRKCGVDMCGGVTTDEVKPLISRIAGSDRELGATLISTTHTDDHERVVGHLQQQVTPERLASLVERVSLVVRRLETGRYLSCPRGLKTATVPAARLFDVLFPEADNQPTLPFNVLAKSILSPRHKSGRWGDMKITRLPMDLYKPCSRIARKRVYTDEGCALRAPYRACIDGRVFTRTYPTPGGTVLIDCSGSMDLSLADIEDIVTTAPASVVAVYSGRRLSGELTIVARNGRVATREGLAIGRSSGSGNIVDGPALKWLATQKGPRIWVSDGFVTGVHDHGSIDLMVAAAVICKKGGITRVSSPAEAIRFLRTPDYRKRRLSV
jgi:hypothetical protein